MVRSGVIWLSDLCRPSIGSQPDFNCRPALTMMNCSWTRRTFARPTSWPLPRLSTVPSRRLTIRRTPCTGESEDPSSTASALMWSTREKLYNRKATTVTNLNIPPLSFCYFYFASSLLSRRTLFHLGKSIAENSLTTRKSDFTIIISRSIPNTIKEGEAIGDAPSCSAHIYR